MVQIGCCCGCSASADEHKIIDCSVCKKSFLHSCVDLSATELRTIKTKKGLSWSCRNCNVLANDINDLKAAILSLRNDILARDSINIDNISESIFEGLLQELDDRNGRKNNIILFNVNEQNSDDSKVRAAQDLNVSQVIIRSLPTPDIDVSNIEVQRLGRFNAGADRSRPLRVKLPSSKDVHRIIKNAKLLRNSPTFGSVRVSFDRTKRQIDFYKKVKTELDTRLARGETNLSIKYDRGVPIIKTVKPLNFPSPTDC